jgi:hypothetical protein
MKPDCDKAVCFFCTRPGLKWPKDAIKFLKQQLKVGKLNLCTDHRKHMEGVETK